MESVQQFGGFEFEHANLGPDYVTGNGVDGEIDHVFGLTVGILGFSDNYGICVSVFLVADIELVDGGIVAEIFVFDFFRFGVYDIVVDA